MKKYLKLGIAALLFAFVFTALSGLSSARANASDGSLEADLDGDGVEETVEWTFDEEEGIITTLTINGADVYKATKLPQLVTPYEFSVSVIDTATSDKYQEVLVKLYEDWNVGVLLFRYDNGKITLYVDDEELYGAGEIISQKKKGYIAVNDYFTVDGIGNLYTVLQYKVKNGKVTIDKNKTYTTSKVNYTTTFKTTEKLTVYKKDNCKDVAGTVKKGGKIKVTKFKKSGDSWLIYIKSGKLKGWVNSADYEVDYFVEEPPLFG